jgi:hypothetical protein
METKFIKIKQGDAVSYINPVFITRIFANDEGRCTVYTMDGRMIESDESANEVMKKIKQSSTFTITLDKQIL